jgi:ATP adenylyltransferase
MERLMSPWRLRYVTSGRRKTARCVFCAAARGRTDRDNLVLLRGRHNFIILNKYPYNNGHLMIVPFTHMASLQEAPEETLIEMTRLSVRCEAALRQVYRPSGINLGLNLGRGAGAGIEAHYHLHMVPRWDGDTNFMTVVHDTRVIPEALRVTYRRLRPLLRDQPATTRKGSRRTATARSRRR